MDDDWSGEVVVEVTDGELTNTASTGVTVDNVQPTLHIDPGSGQFEDIGIGAQFTASGYFIDPGNDAWDFSAVYGNGTIETPAYEPHNPGDPANDRYDFQLSATYYYDAPGVYRVEVTLTDEQSEPVIHLGDAICVAHRTPSRSRSGTEVSSSSWMAWSGVASRTRRTCSEWSW